jgi:tape measure domain-containing protein
MAEESTKVIRIVIDSSKAVDGGRAAQRALEQIEKQTGSMAAVLAGAMGTLARIGGLLAASFSAKAILDAADAFTRFNNSLQVAGVTAGNLATVQERLFAAANRNGVEIGALSQLYSRAAMAGSELGASQDKLLKFVDGVTAALRLQGGSTEAASGALLQLSQSLGSGIVRAEEFNSLLEGAFPIAQAAARGIDGMGGSVAKLRSAIADGHVTSAAFFNGLLKGFTDTEKQAAAMNLTVGAALTVLNNGFTRAVGSADQMTGASAGLASAIANLGRGLDSLGSGMDYLRTVLPQIAEGAATAGAALAVAFAPAATAAMTAGMIALGRAGVAAISVITAAIAANPLGAIAVAITAAVSAIWYFRDNIKQSLGIDVVDVAKKGANFIIGSFVAAYHEIEFVWKNFGTMIGAAVTGGMNAAIRGINTLVQGAAEKVDWLIEKTNKINPFAPIPKIGAVSPIQEFQNPGSAQLDAAFAQRSSQLQKDMTTDYVGAFGDLFRESYGPPVPGARPPPPTAPATAGKQSSEEKSYDKLIAQLTAAAAAQDAMTAAADRGDVAYQAQQIHLAAVQKAIEIFGHALDETDPRLRKIEELMGRATYGKLAEAFAQGTNELRNQNEVLETQLRLMEAAPEVQARELAVIKATQEAKKAGIPLDSDRFKARAAEIEQNETLKLQAEQMKQANELWLEPLRQGLRNIQSAGADAWETILETGNFTFQSLGEVFTKTLRRMAAEFLALATIRPVLSLAVDVIGPNGIGLLGGNGAAQLGFPVGAGGSMGGGGGLGSILGGGGGSIFGSGGSTGGGWLARQFSGIGDWLSSPIAGGGIDREIANWSTYGTAAQNSLAPALGGLTWGQGIAGIGSIGMGAYSMLSGGGSPGSMISGGAGILGGGLALLGPMLGLGAAAGPIGLGIGLVGSLLGGLFGGGGPKIPPMPALAYSGGAFNGLGSGFTTEGTSLGPGSSLASQAQTLATSLTTAFKAAGLTVVPGALIGGGLGVGTAHMWNGKQWTDSPYTETELRLPDGTRQGLTFNDTSRNADQASQYLLTQAFKANVLQGGVSGAGAGLKAGLETINPVTTDDLNRVIALGTAYDKLGQAINPVKDAIDKISASFDDLKDYATQAGLSLDPINDELAKQSKRSAQDFIDAMLDPLALQMRALDDERSAALESAKYIKDNIEGVYVDLDKITDYYGQKRLALEDQYYQGGITNLQALIDRLSPGGALANLDPAGQLAGLKANYQATLDKARTGDAASIANLAGVAGQYAEYGQSYFAGSSEYTALRDQIIAALSEVRAIAQGDNATTTTGASTIENSAAVKDLISQVQQLMAMQREAQKRDDEKSAQITRLTNLLQRYVTAP